MSAHKAIIISLLFSIQYILNCHGAACHELTSQETCELQTGRCVWKSDQKCYCGNNVPINVFFMMDESGSMADNWPCQGCWVDEKNFIVDMIDQALSDDSIVGTMKFSSFSGDSAVRGVFWPWESQLPRSYMNSFILGSEIKKGSTYMSEAVIMATEIYEYWQNDCSNSYKTTRIRNCHGSGCTLRQNSCPGSYEPHDALFVFLTDGHPSSNRSPCPYVEDLQAVFGERNVLVILMGPNTRYSDVECMVTPGYVHGSWYNANPDYARILEVSTFTQAAFDQATNAAAEFLCPDSLSVKLTEVRMEKYVNGAETYETHFIEFVNTGSETIDLSVDSLKFTGFMQSDSFGAATSGGSGCTLTLEVGQYIVIYDPRADDGVPDCPQCNCTLSNTASDPNTGTCSEAQYIPCDYTLGTNGCGTCTWNTQNNSEWDQTIMDWAGDAVLSNTTRTSSDTTWRNVYDGYSTELIDFFYNPSDGVNWDQSCRPQGTPGAPPLATCDVTCWGPICKGNNDGSASCHADGNCDCTAANRYVLTGNGQSCVFMPDPMNCQAENVVHIGMGRQVTSVFWDAGGVMETGTAYEVYTSYPPAGQANTKTAYGKTTEFFFGTAVQATPSNETIKVRATYTDMRDETVVTAWVDCPITTLAPTQVPTASPTYSAPDIASCTTNVRNKAGGGYYIDVYWSKAESTGSDAPADENGNYKYLISGEYIPSSDPSTAFQKPIYGRESDTLSVETLELAANEPVINVAVRYQRCAACALEEGPSTVCDINTYLPTPAPTDVPSETPTEDPTTEPSQSPTQKPTYAAWTPVQCEVIAPSTAALDDGGLVRIEYEVSKPSDASALAQFVISFGSSELSFFVTADGAGRTAWVPSGADLAAFKTAIAANAVDSFQGSMKYADYFGAETMTTGATVINCELRTNAPSQAPTGQPSATPSESPSDKPSTTPTETPSAQPTESPTYQLLTLDACVAEVLDSAGQNVKVTFDEPAFNAGNGDIVPVGQVGYDITVGTQTEYESAGGFTSKTFSNLEPAFDPQQDEVTVAIVVNGIANYNGGNAHSAVTCAIITQAPTKAPITPSPTRNPTSDAPWVFLQLDESSIHTASAWEFDKGCLNYESNEDRRRLAPDWTAYGITDSVPRCTTTENNNLKHIFIKRTPHAFAYDLKIKVEIELLEDSDGSGATKQDFDCVGEGSKPNLAYFEKQQCLALFHTDFETWIYMNRGEQSDVKDIPYYLKTNPNQEMEPLEWFVVKVAECVVVEEECRDGKETEDGDCEEQWIVRTSPDPVPWAQRGVYTCNVGAYWEKILVEIEDVDQDDTFITTTKGDMPMWVWYPIGFAAIAIPIVAYLIWRFYKAKKLADVKEVERTFQLGQAEKQDDVGDFGVVGDHIEANPMATGNQFDVAKGDDIIQQQLEIEKMNFEPATVEVVKDVFKQDFGPVQVEKNFDKL